MNRLIAWGQGAARFAAARIPEIVMVLVGVALRVSLSRTFALQAGYDSTTHMDYSRYLLQHHSLPPYFFNNATCHPPLFYALAALMLYAGFTVQTASWISIVSGSLQVILTWIGVELYLRESRLARILALALLAILPASVANSGFFSNMPLADMFATAALVLFPQVFLRRGRSAVRYGIAAGACMGLSLLTKVSGLMVLVAFLIAVGAAVVRRSEREGMRDLLRGTAAVLVMTAAICGWHYVRHKVIYGKFVLTAYDHYYHVDPVFRIPYFDRRTFGFLTYWNTDIYASPYWASATRPHARFWPIMLATTFSDYYNVAYVARPTPGMPRAMINSNWMRTQAFVPSQLSVAGGTVLLVLALAALLVAGRALWRRGDHARLLLLLAVPLAIIGMLHFAIRFPKDEWGPIKGAYVQFVAPVFCALTGLSIAVLWHRRNLLTRALAIGGIAAIGLVATYTFYAKVYVPLWG